MNLIPVTDARFKKYGRIVKDVDFKELIKEMKKTPCPEDVIYVASVPELEERLLFSMQLAGPCTATDAGTDRLLQRKKQAFECALESTIVLLSIQRGSQAIWC